MGEMKSKLFSTRIPYYQAIFRKVWISGRLNNIRACAREIVNEEIIYV